MYTETKPVWRSQWIKNRKEFWLVVQRHSRKWHILSSVKRTLRYIRERTLTDLWHNSFRWKRLKAGLHTPMPNTTPITVTRYPTVIRWWRRPRLQLRPLDVPQSERESTTTREGESNEKQHVTRQVRGAREKAWTWALVMESVFPTKVSF